MTRKKNAKIETNVHVLSRFSHGMDQSDRFYSINRERDKYLFPTINGHTRGNISEEFARYFSIDDDDDDDIILLDQSEVLFDQVKLVLKDLLEKIEGQEHGPSQIMSIENKRSFDINDTEEYIHNKKVRFSITDDNQQSSRYLFVSETLPSNNLSKPSIQFLSNLGYDLCLEQILPQTNSFSNDDQQTLIKHNAIFHQYSRYSCKYCSFQTNTIHVMDYHYRTPHVYHRDRYRCTYCSFRTFRLSQLRRHFLRKHKLTLISEGSSRRYQCVFCSYETDEKTHFFKHNKRCQIEQTRVCMENNLLAPSDLPIAAPLYVFLLLFYFNLYSIFSFRRTAKPKVLVKNNPNQRVMTTVREDILSC